MILGFLLLGSASAQAIFCDQPFAPLREGWQWQYRMSDGSKTSNYSLQKVVNGSGYISQIRGKSPNGNDFNNDNGYRCSPEGIGSSGEGLFGRNNDINIKSVKVTGLEIPEAEKWEVGYSWKQLTEAQGEGKIGFVTVSGRLISESTYKIMALEAITVPAGRFNAFRVEINTSFKIVASIPLPFGNQTFQSTTWYAENVGTVKSVWSSGKDQNTIELMSLNKGR